VESDGQNEERKEITVTPIGQDRPKARYAQTIRGLEAGGQEIIAEEETSGWLAEVSLWLLKTNSTST